MEWSNWSGRHRSEPESIHFARSTEDVQALVQDLARAGKTVRAAGSGHSHYPLVPTTGTVIDTSGLCGLISADSESCIARVWAGTPIYGLGRPLNDVGLGLKNQGDIDRQAIAGAVATGTHGTGRSLQNLSASVRSATLVLATGECISCDGNQHADLFDIARLGLGAVGVVTQLDMSVRPAYRLREHGWTSDYDAILPNISGLSQSHRHFEFFWYPHRDRVIAKTIDETTDELEYPLASEGERCGWSHEVLPNYRPVKHTEMEFSICLEDGESCLNDIRDLIHRDFQDLRWPVEFRTVAADDVWLSPAYEQDVVTISVHQGIDLDDTMLFRACEEIFRSYKGRPHWGKVHYYSGDDLSRVHPRYQDWWARRDQVDPKGTFLNEALMALHP